MLLGGHNYNDNEDEDRVLKLTDGQWLTMGRMAQSKRCHKMVYVEGQWWMVGGWNSDPYSSRIELWAPEESEYGPELTDWTSYYGFAIIY